MENPTTDVKSENLNSTQLKLRTTPTAGLSSEQSPYYRRLLSAGYKGFLQGTVGGGTLYGSIGAAIGTLVALPLLIPTGGMSLALIPAMAGLGLYKGAGTFGNIGSLAAITAESAEMNERRRYLLDRYNDLPDTPEYDTEAEKIRELLSKQADPKPPEHMFHGRTALVGAALGIALGLFFTLAAPATAAAGVHFVFGSELMAHIGVTAIAGLTALTGAALGGLSGAIIGLDRYYVRNWLDKSASIMHDSRSIEQQIHEHKREIEQLGQKQVRLQPLAARDVANPTGSPSTPAQLAVAERTSTRPEPITPRQIAGLPEQPEKITTAVEHKGVGLASPHALQSLAAL